MKTETFLILVVVVIVAGVAYSQFAKGSDEAGLKIGLTVPIGKKSKLGN